MYVRISCSRDFEDTVRDALDRFSLPHSYWPDKDDPERQYLCADVRYVSQLDHVLNHLGAPGAQFMVARPGRPCDPLALATLYLLSEPTLPDQG